MPRRHRRREANARRGSLSSLLPGFFRSSRRNKDSRENFTTPCGHEIRVLLLFDSRLIAERARARKAPRLILSLGNKRLARFAPFATYRRERSMTTATATSARQCSRMAILRQAGPIRALLGYTHIRNYVRIHMHTCVRCIFARHTHKRRANQRKTAGALLCNHAAVLHYINVYVRLLSRTHRRGVAARKGLTIRVAASIYGP